jgi:transposase-like protein
MGDKELRVNALELNRIGITCPKCKTEMVFDCSSTQPPTGYSCGGCGVSWTDALTLVREYRSLFQQMSALKETVTVSLLVKLDA